jgi:hypothetical protein
MASGTGRNVGRAVPYRLKRWCGIPTRDDKRGEYDRAAVVVDMRWGGWLDG